MKQFLLVALVLSVVGIGCSTDLKVDPLSEINLKSYDINELPYLEMPYIRENVRSTSLENFDQDSVPVFIYEGEEYYHPVFTSLYGIVFVDGFVRTGDPEYLSLAERIAQKLVQNSEEYNNDFLFPYNFDYVYTKDVFMKSPWYSGMAQGRMLTLFSRLYTVTEDPEYLEWAEKTYQSLLLLKGRDENWVSYVDSSRYYWIEEYPAEDPVHVLNGFIFAIFGLYDYYLITKDPEVYRMLSASITTIEYYIEEYRNQDGISYYDLQGRPQSEFYHGVHISQLRILFKLTGENYFSSIADSLENDHSVGLE